jgi:hypothetical protein
MNTMMPVEISPPRYGLVPANMTEAIKLAEMMASAKLVPAALQKSPADCLMVIQQAMRWDMDPFAVAQECSVIQGKLMYSGKLVAAVVNARGNLTQRLSFEYRGQGDDRTIIVNGQLQGEPQPRTVEVILKNAKTVNAMWLKQPDQQLMYHGCRVWARRHMPELMLGVYSPEEFPDESQSRRPQSPAPNVMLPPHDAGTGEIIDDPASPSAGQHEPAFATVKEPAPSQSAPQPDGAGFDLPPDQLETMARNAAVRGEKTLDLFYKARSPADKAKLREMKDELVKLYSRS